MFWWNETRMSCMCTARDEPYRRQSLPACLLTVALGTFPCNIIGGWLIDTGIWFEQQQQLQGISDLHVCGYGVLRLTNACCLLPGLTNEAACWHL